MRQCDFPCLAPLPDRLLCSLIICILAEQPTALLRLSNHLSFTVTCKPAQTGGAHKMKTIMYSKRSPLRVKILGTTQALAFPMTASSSCVVNHFPWEIKCACPRYLKAKVGQYLTNSGYQIIICPLLFSPPESFVCATKKLLFFLNCEICCVSQILSQTVEAWVTVFFWGFRQSFAYFLTIRVLWGR